MAADQKKKPTMVVIDPKIKAAIAGNGPMPNKFQIDFVKPTSEMGKKLNNISSSLTPSAFQKVATNLLFPESTNSDMSKEQQQAEQFAAKGNLLLLTKLIEEKKIDPTQPVTFLGHHLTEIAAKYNQILVLKYLLQDLKMDPNSASTISGKRPLHYAVGEGHADAVQILLENKADPKLTDHRDKTPLANLVPDDATFIDFSRMSPTMKTGILRICRVLLKDEMVNAPKLLIDAVKREN